MKQIFIVILTIVLILTTSCFNQQNKYKLGKNLKENFDLTSNMIKEIKTSEDFISFIDEVKKILIKENKTAQTCQLFGILALNEKNEIYKSIIYYMMSDIYWEQGEKELSLLYMLKVNSNSYNINYESNELGYLIAKRIISYENNLKFKENMYLLLLNDYNDKIDIGYTYLELSKYYKSIYEIDKAINTMNKALIYLPENDASDDANLRGNINSEIYFYKTRKYWIYEDLDQLIGKIKYAINEKNKQLLDQLVSPVNFDIKFLHKNSSQNLSYSYKELEIEKKWSDRIIFSGSLESFSTQDEAYLKTSNWNFPQISTWFLYFKKIYYPFDKKINGCWEWAGIYFGEPN